MLRSLKEILAYTILSFLSFTSIQNCIFSGFASFVEEPFSAVKFTFLVSNFCFVAGFSGAYAVYTLVSTHGKTAFKIQILLFISVTHTVVQK